MHDFSFSRRRLLAGAVAAPFLCGRVSLADERSTALVPARAITRGPKHHWFGYYDKLEFDRTNRYVLSNEVDFEHRTPTADDRIGVGMVDLQDNDKWIPLGESSAWGWQQGCMLQWLPGDRDEVLWNDREDGRFVCRIYNLKTKKTRTLPKPLYAVSPDGRWGVSADFARIQRMRPGYGYQGVEDPVADQQAPKDSGVWRVDLQSGESSLIVSLADIAKIPHQGQRLNGYWHYFNHLLISPSGDRFIFLHRWRKSEGGNPTGGFTTRMFTVAADGSDPYVLDPSGYTSHFIWRDPHHICAWTKPIGQKAAFYLFRDRSKKTELVGDGVMPLNGHNTYLPVQNNDWILNDTYPQGAARQQIPYLYRVSTNRRYNLGRFYSPPSYKGEWRCDTHPRSSNDGKAVVIDSPHGGTGRQLWLLDVSEIIKG